MCKFQGKSLSAVQLFFILNTSNQNKLDLANIEVFPVGVGEIH